MAGMARRRTSSKGWEREWRMREMREWIRVLQMGWSEKGGSARGGDGFEVRLQQGVREAEKGR